MTTALAAGLAGLALLLATRPSPSGRGRPPTAGAAVPDAGAQTPVAQGGSWWLRRHRVLLAAGAGLAGPVWLGGTTGAVVGIAAAAGSWVAVTRAEPGAVVRERRRREAELPHAVLLLSLVLEAGLPVPEALRQVSRALPGSATAALATVGSRFAVGASAEHAWRGLSDEPGLDRLQRTLSRSDRTGAAVAEVVARLARELAEERRAGLEERARSVGVRAAVPLGLCLLPAFVLVGVVPVVLSTLTALRW